MNKKLAQPKPHKTRKRRLLALASILWCGGGFGSPCRGTINLHRLLLLVVPAAALWGVLFNGVFGGDVLWVPEGNGNYGHSLPLWDDCVELSEGDPLVYVGNLKNGDRAFQPLSSVKHPEGCYFDRNGRRVCPNIQGGIQYQSNRNFQGRFFEYDNQRSVTIGRGGNARANSGTRPLPDKSNTVVKLETIESGGYSSRSTGTVVAIKKENGKRIGAILTTAHSLDSQRLEIRGNSLNTEGTVAAKNSSLDVGVVIFDAPSECYYFQMHTQNPTQGDCITWTGYWEKGYWGAAGRCKLTKWIEVPGGAYSGQSGGPIYDSGGVYSVVSSTYNPSILGSYVGWEQCTWVMGAKTSDIMAWLDSVNLSWVYQGGTDVGGDPPVMPGPGDDDDLDDLDDLLDDLGLPPLPDGDDGNDDDCCPPPQDCDEACKVYMDLHLVDVKESIEVNTSSIEANLETLTRHEQKLDELLQKIEELRNDLSQLDIPEDCCDEVMARLDSVEQNMMNLKFRVTSLEGKPDPVIPSIDEIVAAVLAEIDIPEPIPPDVEGISHLVLVSPQYADYWKHGMFQLWQKAKQHFGDIELVIPGKNVGPLPALVAYKGGNPVWSVTGVSQVSLALEQIANDEFTLLLQKGEQ